MTQASAPAHSPSPIPQSVTGVQLARGVGVQQARGFWADAWSQVLKRRAAVLALIWLGIVATLAVLGPVVASGHPLVLTDIATGARSSPLIAHLKSSDIAMLVGVPAAAAWIAFGGSTGRAGRLGATIIGAIQVALTIAISTVVASLALQRDPPVWIGWLRGMSGAAWIGPGMVGLVVLAAVMVLPVIRPLRRRAAVAGAACVLAVGSASLRWEPPLEIFPYLQRELAGEVRATYTAIPWSPSQRFTEMDRQPPGAKLADRMELPAEAPARGRIFWLGTDAFGQDVLTQLIHACRLSISIGLVSTGIATLIGVTVGALMGYFGGWVDMILFRVVEIFMAVPLLFLLILAAALIPPEARSTYVMMAIIGAFTWTGAARFTRAEFLKLRRQDFVQAAQAVGLPLRSVLFRHMLPNGVTPVLVDASFAIAAAISIEATLSFLGLGPIDQASWGKLLSTAISSEGVFKWWLAVFPGGAIFLTVLSYNLIGEALRDAIDPKLKKARV